MTYFSLFFLLISKHKITINTFSPKKLVIEASEIRLVFKKICAGTAGSASTSFFAQRRWTIGDLLILWSKGQASTTKQKGNKIYETEVSSLHFSSLIQ